MSHSTYAITCLMRCIRSIYFIRTNKKTMMTGCILLLCSLSSFARQTETTERRTGRQVTADNAWLPGWYVGLQGGIPFGFSTFRAFLADIGYKVKTRRRIINTPDWRMSKVSGEQIRRVLDRYDIILGRPRRVHGSVWEQYSHYHPSAGLQVTREAIKALFPDYIDSFDYVMHKTKRLSRCNMFITGWKVFDDYCSWLFPVLSYVERHTTIPEDPYQARIFGFIAERLLNVYCYHNRLKKTYRYIYEVTGSATPVNP